jgi:spore maturation protein CgeB
MKTILSGVHNPHFEALPEYLAAALARLGHEVTRFDHRDFLLPGRLRQRWPFLDRLDRDRLNERLVDLARRVRPDLLIVNQGTVLTQKTLDRLRQQGVRCVNWFSDYPAEYDAGLRMTDAYDAFFLGSSYAAARHREAGRSRSFWLPFACDPGAHHPDAADTPTAPGDPAEVPPVVFVGSHYPERQILLRFLRGLPVGIWGPGWERAADDPMIRPMIRGGALRPGAWRSLYARSRVVLNIHYGAFGPIEASGDLASTRVFEILACGAFQVVNRQGDVLRLFRDGEHLSVFSGGDELRSRVEQALADDARRQVVARTGRAEALARHTYMHRARVLLDPAARDFIPVADAWPQARSAAAGVSR